MGNTSITEKLANALTNQSQDGTVNSNTTQANSNNGKLDIEVTIDGKKEIKSLSLEEIAEKVQLASVSTQRFQEASELRKKAMEEASKAQEIYDKLSKNVAAKPEQTTQNIVNDDDDDSLILTIKELKKEIEELKNSNNNISNEVFGAKRNNELNDLSARLNIDRAKLDKEIIPIITESTGKELKDISTLELEMFIKASLYELGNTKNISITPDTISGRTNKPLQTPATDMFGKKPLTFEERIKKNLNIK